MSARNDPPPAADQPAPPRSPETNQASQVDLQDTRRRQAGALPHERDQRPADRSQRDQPACDHRERQRAGRRPGLDRRQAGRAD